jgi:hypothetical protein
MLCASLRVMTMTESSMAADVRPGRPRGHCRQRRVG